MKKIIVLAIIFTSCAFYRSANELTQSNVKIRGGVFGDKNWSDSLMLRRTSWYNGATLYNDIFLGKLAKDNPFSNWIKDKKAFNKCENFFIAITYNYYNSSADQAFLRSQLEKNNLEFYSIPQFVTYLQAHYSYQDWHMKNYKIQGFCQKENSSEVKVTLPGHNSINIL